MDIRKRSKILRATVGCMGLLLLQLNSPFVNADGFETLGPPTGITIENGTGLISAGIGLSQAQPGNLVFDSGTATIVQVLLYWAGNSNNSTHTPPGDGLGDPDITVNGIPVNGTRIMNGGTMTLGEANSSAYRADITDLKDGAGLPVISTGLNTLSIGGLDFTSVNYGAGVVVIVDDGSVPAHKIDVRDGNDYAFIGSSVVDQDTTVCQTFMFDSSPDSRSANLELLFSSVAGIASTGDFRPSAIDVTIGGETVSGVCGVGGTTTTYNNLLNSYDGQEWDSISIDVPVPANETQVSVQALSEQNNDDNIPAGADVGFPASFHWLAAGLSIAPPPPPPPVNTPGRMTGGGKIRDNGIMVKTSFTVHCDITLSNNIQINWKDQGKNNKWHITKPIKTATCTDELDVEPPPPAAPFDTFVGEAVGKLNGKKGSILRFTFVDGGEPGKEVDSMAVSIWKRGDDPDTDKPVLKAIGPLIKGDYQAHYDQPHK